MPNSTVSFANFAAGIRSGNDYCESREEDIYVNNWFGRRSWPRTAQGELHSAREVSMVALAAAYSDWRGEKPRLTPLELTSGAHRT